VTAGRFIAPFDRPERDRDLEACWVKSVTDRRLGAPEARSWDSGPEQAVIFDTSGTCNLEGLALLEVTFEESYSLLRFAFGKDETAAVLYAYPSFTYTPNLIAAASRGRLWVPTEKGMLEIPLAPQIASELRSAAYAAQYSSATRAARAN
jgi:hypothetical protein